jgi:hypothetical protein
MDQLYLKDSQVFYLQKDSFNELGTDCELKTTFKKPIHLERQMECALLEIKIPKNFFLKQNQKKFVIKLHFENDYDIRIHYNTLKLVHNINPDLKVIPENFDKNYTISTKNFNNIQNLYENIEIIVNEDIKAYIVEKCQDLYPTSFTSAGEPNGDGIVYEPMTFKINEKSDGKTQLSTRLGTLSIQDDKGFFEHVATFYISFNKELHELLQITSDFPLARYSNELDIPNQNIIKNILLGTKIEDKDMIFIYADIIRESFIDNIRANILRIVSLETDKTYYSFKHQIFIPMRVEEFNSLNVSIRNSEGKILYFNEGSICIALLLRPIEYI